MSYADDLGRALAAAGIQGARRARIVAEIEDHLACDPRADLGDPAALGQQFADELGTSLARRAAFASFAALAVAACALAVAFVSQADRGLAREIAQSASAGGNVGIWLMALGSQVALVSGALAALRAVRRRREATVSRAQGAVVLRRSAVGIGAGAVAMAGLAVTALAWRHGAPASYETVALSAAGAGGVALLAAIPTVITAARVRPAGAGAAGDLAEDLGPLMPAPLRAHPWRLALLVSGLVAIFVAVAGVAQADPFDGALRGIAEGGACLTGFALLGRYLGLRP